MRHLQNETATLPPLSGDEIRLKPEHANMIQAGFARKLHLTPGYVSQIEREVKRPTGLALVLLHLIQRQASRMEWEDPAWTTMRPSAGVP